MKTSPENNLVCQELSALVAREVLGLDVAALEVTKLDINDFSMGFFIDERNGSQGRGVYVKISKGDLFKSNILPITAADQRLAEDEYQSLVRLAELWRSEDVQVGFVQPLGFFREYNAVVTRRADANYFLLELFRSRDFARKLRINPGSDRVEQILFRIGKALYQFHEKSGFNKSTFDKKNYSKITNYCNKLINNQVGEDILNRVLTEFPNNGPKPSVYLTNTIKGLDIRNVLVDDADKVFMFDPGKMKKDCREADLARFLVTCRILYWGSLRFFLRFTPQPAYDESFLRGYYGSEARGDWVLAFFTIKELLKHWLMAYVALGLKRWPKFVATFFRLTYIDPFYRGQIAAELRKLK